MRNPAPRATLSLAVSPVSEPPWTAVETTEPGGPVSGPDGPAVARRIARFTLLERLGRGGMGEVYTAYDPQLDRRVAIKLLRPDRRDATAQARLLREAQAMARLSHPNVVQVFEAGLTELEEHGVDPAPLVFIAMEFVQGRTLRRWLSEAERTVEEILAAFVQAGTGLVAAHVAGLVHRDFKPDNVLVGDDGRIRVADLGLARAVLGGTSQPSITDGGTASGPADDRLTATGAAAGTPAYMAPEQFLGEPVDARADQFAFCIALWEAIYGERPFAGRSRIEIASAVIDGALRPAPRGIDVPARVHDLLRVGLARDPAERHPSMSELLHGLAHDPRRRRRRVIALGAGALAVVASLWLGTRIAAPPKAVSPCAGAADDLESVWNATRRERLADAMEATSVAFASRAATQVVEGIDAHARAWAASAEDACAATRVRGEQSEALFDRRRRCLDRRRQELAALLDVLGEPDAELVERAPAAVQALPDVRRCDDTEFVSAQIEPPTDPRLAARVDALRDRLAHAVAQRHAGRTTEALEASTSAVGEARALSYAPLTAEALLAAGEATDVGGDPIAAEPLLREAYLSALRLGLDEVAAAAASRLVYTVGHGLGRSAEAREWATHARALLDRPGADPLRRTSLLNNEAAVQWHHGDYDRAERGFAEVLARWRDAHGQRSAHVAIALTNLGALAYARGDTAAAIAAFEEALSIERERLGDEHPDVGSALGQLGAAHWLAGDLDRALDHFEGAVASVRAARGEDHPEVAKTLLNLAGVELSLERHDDAISHLERACEIYEARSGPDSESFGQCLHNLAVAKFHAGGDAEAEAEALASRGLAIVRRSLPADHPEVVRGIRFASELAEARGDLEAARQGWAEVLELRERTGAPAADIGDARFGLARVRWTGRGGANDEAAVRAARAAYLELSTGHADLEAAEVSAWLKERGLSVDGGG